MNHEATKITKKREEVIKIELSKFHNPTVIANFSASLHFFVSFVPSWLKSLRCRIRNMRQFFLLVFLVFGLAFSVVLESMAQPPDGGGRRGGGFRQGGGPPGGGRPRLQTPEAIIGVPDPPRPSGTETTLGIGTVPALWEIPTPYREDDELMSLEGRGTIAPPVPAKIVRYAIHLLARYDTNGDGVLQKEEWMKMSGSPQAIDIDGDGNIELDELIRYLAVYGEKRTIHRPNPIETFYQPRIVSSQFQLFKPLTAPLATPKPPEGEPSTPTAEDMTEERVELDDEFFEDTTYEDIVSDLLAPADKKYYTAPEALRGVPRWFIALDRDGDGQVSLREFAPNMSPASLALFGRFDKNGDGFITPDEVRKEEPPKQEVTPTEPAATETPPAQ